MIQLTHAQSKPYKLYNTSRYQNPSCGSTKTAANDGYNGFNEVVQRSDLPRGMEISKIEMLCTPTLLCKCFTASKRVAQQPPGMHVNGRWLITYDTSALLHAASVEFQTTLIILPFFSLDLHGNCWASIFLQWNHYGNQHTQSKWRGSCKSSIMNHNSRLRFMRISPQFNAWIADKGFFRLQFKFPHKKHAYISPSCYFWRRSGCVHSPRSKSMWKCPSKRSQCPGLHLQSDIVHG